MNNITIAGQLGRDAEVRYLQDGTAIASFSVADSQGREKTTIWWRCGLFGKRAESSAEVAKQMRFLQQRGFSASAIGAVMRRARQHSAES